MSIKGEYTVSDIDGNEVHMHYAVAGSGTDIVFLHGWAGSIEHWFENPRSERGVFECLYENEFRVIAYDLIGHGKTKRTVPGTIANNYKAVANSNRHLSVDRPVYIAHSLSAVLLLLHLEDIDTAGICFIDPTLLPNQLSWKDKLYAKSGGFSRILNKLFMKSEAKKQFYSDEGLVEWSVGVAKQADSRALREFLGSAIKEVENNDLFRIYNESNVRKLLVTGERGEIAKYINSVKGNKSIVKSASHCPHIEATEEFVKVLHESLLSIL